MNYFAHFVVDHQIGRHEFNTGLLLPDITRGYLKSLKREVLNTDATSENFYQGCLAHYRADKFFHGSSFFTNLLALTNTFFNEASFSPALNRKWFLAHITAELLIDRQLINQRPDLLDEFYLSLQSINDNDLLIFLNLHEIQDSSSFFEFFNHFRKVQYIRYYTNNNKFVYSLNRIMIRAGVGSMSDSDLLILQELCVQLESHMLIQNTDLIGKLKQSVQ